MPSEVDPPLDRKSGFYSRYFIVPKEDRGLSPILDLSQLNCSVMRLKFRMGWGPSVTSSPVLASMVLGPDFHPRLISMGDSRQEGSPLTGGGYAPSPPPRVVEAVGVASEGAQLVASSLSTEVVETILQSRAPSTRQLYALKWKLFTSWFEDHQLDPFSCPVGTMLEFL